MVKHKGGTDKSQTWLTFLRNHLEVSWAMDFFTVPTVRFQILYIFVIASFPSPGCAFCCDGASDDGLGDPATAGSDAFWSTAQLSVP